VGVALSLVELEDGLSACWKVLGVRLVVNVKEYAGGAAEGGGGNITGGVTTGADAESPVGSSDARQENEQFKLASF
jgi:hypothetical protein